MIELASSEVSGLVLTFGQTTNRVSGRVSDGSGAPDPEAAVIVFPADSSAWRESIFTGRRTRKANATSAGSYDVATFAPGDYYVAAVATRQALDWQNPAFLERLIAGATRVTLGAEDQKTVPLRTHRTAGARTMRSRPSRQLSSSRPARPSRLAGARPECADDRRSGGTGVVTGVVVTDTTDPSRFAAPRSDCPAWDLPRGSWALMTRDASVFDRLPAGRVTLSAAKAGFVQTFHGRRGRAVDPACRWP